jgi:hypothetical protein
VNVIKHRSLPLLVTSLALTVALGPSSACSDAGSRPRSGAGGSGGAGGSAGAQGMATGGSGGGLTGGGGTGGGSTAMGGAGGGNMGGNVGSGGSGSGTGGSGARDAGGDGAMAGGGGTGGARDGGTADAPAGGGDGGGARDVRGPDVPPPATFATVQAILEMKCAGCHEPLEPMHTNFEPMGLYARLVNARPTSRSAAACRNQILVTPNDLAKSLIYQKIIPNGVLVGCGTRMPKECFDEYCITDTDIQVIRDWILAGAKP